MIHLDTSFLIRGLVRGTAEDRFLREWLRRDIPLAISAVGWTEFLCGPVAAAEAELATRIVPDRVPFTADDSVEAARLFNLSGRRRGSLADCMIAATAVRLHASLATTNPADFRRLESAGLQLVATSGARASTARATRRGSG